MRAFSRFGIGAVVRLEAVPVVEASGSNRTVSLLSPAACRDPLSLLAIVGQAASAGAAGTVIAVPRASLPVISAQLQPAPGVARIGRPTSGASDAAATALAVSGTREDAAAAAALSASGADLSRATLGLRSLLAPSSSDAAICLAGSASGAAARPSLSQETPPDLPGSGSEMADYVAQAQARREGSGGGSGGSSGSSGGGGIDGDTRKAARGGTLAAAAATSAADAAVAAESTAASGVADASRAVLGDVFDAATMGDVPRLLALLTAEPDAALATARALAASDGAPAAASSAAASLAGPLAHAGGHTQLISTPHSTWLLRQHDRDHGATPLHLLVASPSCAVGEVEAVDAISALVALGADINAVSGKRCSKRTLAAVPTVGCCCAFIDHAHAWSDICRQRLHSAALGCGLRRDGGCHSTAAPGRGSKRSDIHVAVSGADLDVHGWALVVCHIAPPKCGCALQASSVWAGQWPAADPLGG